jgi:hypothetical protein
MSRRKWLCLDCKIDTGKISEHYFIKTSIWMEVVGSIEGMLCIGCLEKRLNRCLTKNDFTDCYLNDPKIGSKSERFLARLKSL